MQTSATIILKRNSAPLFVLLGSILTTMVSLPAATHPGSFSAFSFGQTQAETVPPVTEEYVRAIERFEAGDFREAGAILDTHRNDPLPIRTETGDSASATGDLPTTVLMRLGRTIRQEALREIGAGETDVAKQWAAHLQSLTERTLRTPTPCYDAVWTAYYLASHKHHLDSELAKKTGTVAMARQAATKEQHFEALWNREILPHLRRQDSDRRSATESSETEEAGRLLKALSAEGNGRS